MNYPYIWDCNPSYRKLLYKEESVSVQGKNFSYIRTLGWSDNNHLTTRDYYLNLILPLVGRRRIFPENVANLASGIFNHKLLGTFIYGGLGEQQTIFHLDGRGSQDFPEVAPRGGKQLIDHNLLRIGIQFQRLYYKSKLIFLGARNFSKYHTFLNPEDKARIHHGK